jgi:hypothetical protein
MLGVCFVEHHVWTFISIMLRGHVPLMLKKIRLRKLQRVVLDHFVGNAPTTRLNCSAVHGGTRTHPSKGQPADLLPYMGPSMPDKQCDGASLVLRLDRIDPTFLLFKLLYLLIFFSYV